MARDCPWPWLFRPRLPWPWRCTQLCAIAGQPGRDRHVAPSRVQGQSLDVFASAMSFRDAATTSRVRRILVLGLVLLGLGVGIARGAGPASPLPLPCGLPQVQPLWVDYADGGVPFWPTIFARPGVVGAASNFIVPPQLRAKGAQTVYFDIHL